jgi:4-hydroxy-tetrahydrodipicolinate reductase
MQHYKIVQFGFGSLGVEIFKTLHGKRNCKIVGVVDIDDKKIGIDAGVLAFKKRTGIKIVNNINTVRSKPDIAIHATTSSLQDAFDQISEIVKRRISVISTCEQLVYPYGSNAKLAHKLDRLAKRYKVSVLGTGVNPGFVMDSLVLALTGLCSKIDQIRVERVVDVVKRRKSLQEKTCVGFTLEQFEKVKDKVGHVGLYESAMMICDTLNVKGTVYTKIRPVIASSLIKSYDVTVEPGHVAGIEHRLVVKKGKENKFLEMVLYMFAGASEFDLIEIDGISPVYVKTNGISGDHATIALLLNYIPIIMQAKPGLHRVNKLPIPSASFAS